MKYEEECNLIGLLAKRYLNEVRIAIPWDFEAMQVTYVFMLISDEYNALRDEVLYRPGKDKTRAIASIGKLSGYLAGLLANLNKSNEVKK